MAKQPDSVQQIVTSMLQEVNGKVLEHMIRTAFEEGRRYGRHEAAAEIRKTMAEIVGPERKVVRRSTSHQIRK